MFWIDYTIEQFGKNFIIKGDWPGEVMGIARDGTTKDNYLYRPGDVFIVNSAGMLIKQDKFIEFMEHGRNTINKSDS